MSEKNEKKSSLEKFNEENKDFKKEFAKRVTDGESAYTGKIPVGYIKPIEKESLS